MTFRFDEDTRFVRIDDERYEATLSDRFNIGAVPNGGYVMALMGRVAADAAGGGDIINVSAYYLGPTTPGAATLRVSLLKQGRRMSFVTVALVQGERVCVHASAFVGALDGFEGPTESWVAPPELPPVDACPRHRAGMGSRFQEQVDVRFAPGAAAFMEGRRAEPTFAAWLRLADGRPLDTASLLLFADALPPTSFNAYGVRGWVPTLELGVQVREAPVGEWLSVRMTTRHIGRGHMEEDGEMWDERGVVVAVTRQRAMLLG